MLQGHTQPVFTVAISPDNHWLATGGFDGETRLWDLTAGNPAAHPVVLGGHMGPILSVAFSPDGRWLATGSQDKTARLWNMAASDPSVASISLPGHEAGVKTIVFSPDGRWLATHGGDFLGSAGETTVRMWDLNARDPAAQPLALRASDIGATDMAFSPDSRWLGAGTIDQKIVLWDVTAGDPLTNPIILPDRGVSSTIAFSPDKHWLISGGVDGAVRLWDLTDKDFASAEPIVLRGHQKEIVDIAVNLDSRWLVTGSDDATSRIWNLAARDPAAASVPLSGHETTVMAVAISSDSRQVITAAQDTTVRVWPLRVEDLAVLACRAAGRNLTWPEWQQYFPGQTYHKTCASLPVPPSVIAGTLERARAAVQAGRSRDASSALAQATTWAIERHSRSMTEGVCLQGSLDGLARVVMAACEHAVSLSPDSGRAHDDRGIARALSGDRAGAIEDLTRFVQWLSENNIDDSRRGKFEAWLTELRAGRDPFDPATLEELRKEWSIPATFK
jgi:WD40 repeat protein